MERETGIEPATNGLGSHATLPLSYSRFEDDYTLQNLERQRGIEVCHQMRRKCHVINVLLEIFHNCDVLATQQSELADEVNRILDSDTFRGSDGSRMFRALS